MSAGEALQAGLVGDAALAVRQVGAQRRRAGQGAALQAAGLAAALLGGRPGGKKGGEGGTQCVAGWVDEHCENVKLVQLFCRFKTEYEFETYKELTSRSEGLFCSR